MKLFTSHLISPEEDAATTLQIANPAHPSSFVLMSLAHTQNPKSEAYVFMNQFFIGRINAPSPRRGEGFLPRTALAAVFARAAYGALMRQET